MRTFIAILFIFTFNSCSFTKEQHILESKIQDTNLLRKLINQKKINGQIILNDFNDDIKIDSFVNVSVNYPFEQNYPIDSIYYFYQNESNYKILAKSEFEKGLLYLEVDKKGNHTRYFNFGGYIIDVSNVLIRESLNDIELTFTVDVWPSTMPDTITQNVKITSSLENINFHIFYKNDKELWIEDERN